MRKQLRVTIILAVSMVIPLVLVLLLGLSGMQEDRDRSRSRTAALLSFNLAAVTNSINQTVADIAVSLHQSATAAWLPTLPETFRQVQWLGETNPLVRFAAVIDANGSFLYPSTADQDQRSNTFRERIAPLAKDGWTPAAWHAEIPNQDNSHDAGFISWQWGEGTQWLYFTKHDKFWICLELNRPAFMARILSNLASPSLAASDATLQRIRLVDEQRTTIYQWGNWENPANQAELARISPGYPLGHWEAIWELDETLWAGYSQSQTIIMTLALIMIALLSSLGGMYGFRLLRKEIQEAGQRVSFVNQVSHELKTPLTNIRLYAELLEQQLLDLPDESASTSLEHIEIIKRETLRLSRLIHNVLSFASKDKAIQLRPRPINLAEHIQLTAATFQASFAEKGLSLVIEQIPESDGTPAHSAPSAFLDPDVLDQILGNLLSNAEKYAASGGVVQISHSCSTSTSCIQVRDFGPGLPDGCKPRLFGAFERFHHAVTDAVGGTGLGLHLGRELARLHGGDLVLLDHSGPGCLFALTLAHTITKKDAA